MSGPTRFIPKAEDIPHELAARKQWVSWKWGQANAKTGLLAKIPYVRNPETATLTADKWNERPEWFDHFDTALRRMEVVPTLAGVGFVLRHDLNPVGKILIAIDVDDHSPTHERPIVQDGVIVDPTAKQLVEALNSYTEITPSGFGFRTFVLVPEVPPGIGSTVTTTTWRDLPIEIYLSNKFVTVTGQRIAGPSAQVEMRYLRNFVTELRKPEQASGKGPRRIMRSDRHDFFRRKLTALIKSGWITDRDLLIKNVLYLRDKFCEAPEEKTLTEIETFVDWALLRLTPNPLWKKNDEYVASQLVLLDSKYAAAWRGDLSAFDGDVGAAFNYAADRLMEACGDSEQAIRIFRASPFAATAENFLQEQKEKS